MTQTKYINSSETTSYQVKLETIKDNLFTVSVKYIINQQKMKTPILYYRIHNYEYATGMFNNIVNFIEDNKNSLCIEKMKNWIFNVHIIRHVMKSRN